MKLLKLILFFFAIYFIRRFIQFYRAMKATQERNIELEKMMSQKPEEKNSGKTVEAEFKVVDR